MMTLSELWKHFKWLSDPEGHTKEERAFLVRFLAEEYRLRGTEETGAPPAHVGDQKGETAYRLRLDLQPEDTTGEAHGVHGRPTG